MEERHKTAAERLWVVMRAMTSFTTDELAMVSEVTYARTYQFLNRLEKAGYVNKKEARRGGRGGVRWQLIKNTGPKAPRFEEIVVLKDSNTGARFLLPSKALDGLDGLGGGGHLAAAERIGMKGGSMGQVVAMTRTGTERFKSGFDAELMVQYLAGDGQVTIEAIFGRKLAWDEKLEKHRQLRDLKRMLDEFSFPINGEENGHG